MLEIEEQIEILNKFKAGCIIQYSTKGNTVTQWMALPNHGSSYPFNFETYYYRVKPKAPKYVSVLESDYSKTYEMYCRLDEPKQGEFSNYVLQDARKVKYLLVPKSDELNGCMMFDDIYKIQKSQVLNDNCYIAKILILDT